MTGFATDAIHAGYEPDSLYGPINAPIYASTTFAQNAPNDLRGGFEYGRVANPTVASLAKTIAALEGAEFGKVFASGMAATDIILRAILRPGDLDALRQRLDPARGRPEHPHRDVRALAGDRPDAAGQRPRLPARGLIRR